MEQITGANFTEEFFYCSSNFTLLSLILQHITTNFCICYSTDVMQCAKFCCNHFVRIEVRAKQEKKILHRILIALEKMLMKWAEFYFFHCGAGCNITLWFFWLQCHVSTQLYLKIISELKCSHEENKLHYLTMSLSSDSGWRRVEVFYMSAVVDDN